MASTMSSFFEYVEQATSISEHFEVRADITADEMGFHCLVGLKTDNLFNARTSMRGKLVVYSSGQFPLGRNCGTLIKITDAVLSMCDGGIFLTLGRFVAR